MPTTDIITQISDETYEELGRPDDTSISAIAFWMRSNIGTLNILINKSFVLNSDESITPEIDRDARNILTRMFEVRYYAKKLLNTTGAAGYSPVKRVNSDGMSVEYMEVSNMCKVWLEAKKEAQLELDTLVNAYKVDKVMPNQVAGDDTEASTYWISNSFVNSRNVQIG